MMDKTLLNRTAVLKGAEHCKGLFDDIQYSKPYSEISPYPCQNHYLKTRKDQWLFKSFFRFKATKEINS
jgi:hypothetical protein